MKKTLSRALALYLTLQPALAFASFDTPSALQKAIMNDGAPRSFSGQMHGSFVAPDNSTVYLSLWTSGEQTGTGVRDNSLSTKITVDVSVPSVNLTVRTKFQMRKVKQSMFVQLQSVDATFEDDLNKLGLAYIMKKWIEVPLSEEYMAMLENTEGDTSIIDDVLTLEKTKTRAGYSYSLTLDDAFLNDLVGGTETFATNLHVKIDTNSVDQFLFGKLDFSADFSTGSEKNTMVITGSSQRMNRAVVVTAPKDSIMYESLADRYPQAFGLFPLSPLDALNLGNDTYEDEYEYLEYPEENNTSSSDDWYESDDSSEVTPEESVTMPTNYRPSRRTLLKQRAEEEALRLEQKVPSSSSSGSPSSVLESYVTSNFLPPSTGLSVGSVSAPIIIVEAGDYQCPFCAKFHKETFPEIKKNFIDTGKVRFVFRNYPLPFHENAMYAANIVECTRNLSQGDDLAWKVHHAFFDSVASGQEFTELNIEKIVRSLTGKDAETTITCAKDEENTEIIMRDMRDADNAGFTGAPGFWILSQDGSEYAVLGAQPYTTFENLLNAILQK